MLKNIFLHSFILLFLFAFPANIYSQKDINYSQSLPSGNFNFGNWFTGTKNFIEITYGFGKFHHNDIKTEFSPLIIKEFKFGKRYQKPIANYTLLEFNDNYIFSSNIIDDNNLNSLNIKYEFWRFGLGYKKGYGYNFENFAILPFYQLGFVWTKSDINHPYEDVRLFNDDGSFIKENNLLKKYDREIKFGTTNIGGVDVRISSLFTAGVSYETSIIFPSHLVWKQLGSFFIETLSQTGLDYLTEGVIIKNAPAIAPLFYLIAKNTLSYYLFTLKQKDMNWPFNTVAPLNFETLKFNLKVTF